jgi:hypothetical protein
MARLVRLGGNAVGIKHRCGKVVVRSECLDVLASFIETHPVPDLQACLFPSFVFSRITEGGEGVFQAAAALPWPHRMVYPHIW